VSLALQGTTVRHSVMVKLALLQFVIHQNATFLPLTFVLFTPETATFYNIKCN